MSRFIFLLGREPDISLAELKSLFFDVKRVGDFAFLETEEDIAHRLGELGGTIKVGHVIASSVSRSEVEKVCSESMTPFIQSDKKTRIAVDVFVSGFRNLVFQLKERLKKQGHSIRVVQHDNGRVKTATTLHEKLIEKGCELMLISDGNGYSIARTIWVQDIDAYTKRDIGRERSMKVGMMPPKLAQIMINLATKGDKNLSVWDPFCGLGTTLIEADHMGYEKLIGSDLSPDMVSATTANLVPGTGREVFYADARKIDMKRLSAPTVIVTEGMLGHNFTPGTLTHQAAFKERGELQKLYTDFFASAFHNSAIQSIVCCLPVWNINSERIFMPTHAELAPDWTLDSLCQVGKRYLLHARPGQSVTREILVLRRR